jgi:hypothetical protein
MKKDSERICEIQLKPKERSRIPLGEFDLGQGFKGLSIEIIPDPDPDNSVEARIIQVGSGERSTYKLLLHIANHGNKAVTAVVSQV